MNKRIIFSTFLTLVCVAAGASAVFAQGRYVNVYNRNQVEAFIRQLEESSDAFRDDFRRQVNNSRLNASTRRTFNGHVDQFENAVDRLRSRFDTNDSWWESRNEVRNMISSSQNLNTTMNRATFRRQIEQQWNRLRNDVNRLADTYDLPGLAGGGWTGGGGGNFPGGGAFPGGGGNVPSWAAGTFYGRDPRTGSVLTMTVNRNGSVMISVDGDVPVYASMNGTTLTNGPYVSRVTRRGNGIRTTDVNNRNYIDYSRTSTGIGPWNPPGGGGQQGNVPTWAVGSFYGRDPSTGSNVMMTINRNGSVSISVDGAQIVYASMNGTTLTNGPYVSRVTRINNGIRTTDVNGGQYIDYRRR